MQCIFIFRVSIFAIIKIIFCIGILSRTVAYPRLGRNRRVIDKMKIFLLLTLLTWQYAIANAEICARPNVERRRAYVYRTMSLINTTVRRCVYSKRLLTYSNITNNCLSAIKTVKRISKFKDSYYDLSSSVAFDEHNATADLLKNVIYLRSGSTCRYDRGFCYDDELNYINVWNVTVLSNERCATNLELIFARFVDVLTFTPKNLSYLFYFAANSDKSFALRLESSSKFHDKEVWHTDERGYIVSFAILSYKFRYFSAPWTDVFNWGSKKRVSEAIFKDCDLKTDVLDFENEIHADYLIDPVNLKSILLLYQKNIDSNRKSLVAFGANVTLEERALKVSKQDSKSTQEVDDLKRNDKELFLAIQRLTKNITDLKLSVSNSYESKNNNLNDFKIFKNEIAEKYNNLLSLQNITTKTCTNDLTKVFSELNLLHDKTNTNVHKIQILEQEVLKAEGNLSRKISVAEADINKYLANLNQTILKQINLSHPKTTNLETQYKHFVVSVEDNFRRYKSDLSDVIFSFKVGNERVLNEYRRYIENATELKIREIGNNITNTLVKKLSGVEHEVYQKIHPVLQSELVKYVTDKILESQHNIYNHFDRVNANHSNKIDYIFVQITNTKDSIGEIYKAVDNNKKETEIIRDRVNKNEVLVTNSLSNVKSDILKELSSLLKIVKDNSDSCVSEIENLKHIIENKTDENMLLNAKKANENVEIIIAAKIQLNDLLNITNTLRNIASKNTNLALNLEHRVNVLSADIYDTTAKVTEINESAIFINKSLKHTNDNLKILQKSLRSNDNKINDIFEQLRDFKNEFNITYESSKYVESTITSLQKQAEESKTLKSDMSTLKDNINKSQQLLVNNDKIIESLRKNVTSCDGQQQKNNEEIEKLRKEIQQIKEEFKKSLADVQILLKKKNDENAEVKTKLLIVSSCCSENTKNLKENENKINKLNDDFVNTTKIVFKKIDDTLQEIFKDQDLPVS